MTPVETPPGRLKNGARIVVIMNSASGTDDKSDAENIVRTLFLTEGVEVEVVLMRPDAGPAELAAQAVAAGCEIVVAAGGDGTVNGVASVLAGTETVLGVLPMGTLNHFAKDLGIPLTLPEAVKNVLAGEVRRVDVGEVNGRVFVNNSSVGLYPTLVKRREAHQRLGKGKWSAFVRAALTVLGRYPLVRVSLKLDDGNLLTRKTPLVFIGNNEYRLEGLKLGGRSRLDAGILSVYVTRDIGRLKLVWFALRALFGKLRAERDFDDLQAAAVTITSTRSTLRVSTDGEVRRLATPLAYRIRPGELSVKTPRPVAEAADTRLA